MRYYVQIIGTYATDGFVEAETQEEAYELAQEAYHCGEFDSDSEVSNVFYQVEEA